MIADAALESGRRLAEALMQDAVEVFRDTGAVDPVTYEPVRTVVYTGKAKVQTYEPHETAADVGGGSATVQRYSVHVPVGPYEPMVDDIVTVTAASLDPQLAGRKFVVRGLLHKTYATAYRLLVNDNGTFGGAP